MLVENSSIPKPFHTQPCKVKHKYALGFDGHRKPLGKASEWTTGKLVLDSWSSYYSNFSQRREIFNCRSGALVILKSVVDI